tara:strand:- start:2320 stop:3726 length:1407 start_codon:yes stop_codon:yes gene_type:complete
MVTLAKLISIYVLSFMVLGVTGNVYIAIFSFFTLSCHWLAISRFLQGPSLYSSRNILMFYSFLLCLISIISYTQSVIIGGELTPYLGGSDGEGYFELALAVSGSDKINEMSLITGSYFGYQIILSTLFDILGQNLFVGLLLNNTLLLLTVLLIVRVTWILTKDNQSCFYSALAFILTTKFIFYSNALLKDPFLSFGVALVIYMVAMIHTRKAMMLSSYLALIFAALIFGVMRQPMLILIPISFILLGRTSLKTIWLPGILLFILGSSFLSVISSFSTHLFSVEQIINIVSSNQLLSNAANDGANIDGIVGTVSTAYGQLPILIRMLLIPIPATLQFILPFNFWSTNFLNDHLIHFFNVNGNIVWYLFIGVFMIYGMVYWRRLPKNMSTRLFLFGAGAYLAHALVFGGVVPRYGSPYLVMMFPTIGFLMSCLTKKRGDYIHIRKFFQNYYFLVLIAGTFFVYLSLTRYT